jgi:general secretion pathway protein I
MSRNSIKLIQSSSYTGKPLGFTLLETIVALVIFTSSGLALYGLMNTNLTSLTRIKEVSSQVPVVKNSIEYLSAMNLQGEQDGEFEMNGFNVQWQARLLEPLRETQNTLGYRGYHNVGLYKVDFQIRDADKTIGNYQLRLVGHELVRGPGV